MAHGGGKEAVAGEDDEGQQHEHAAQAEHAGERVRVGGADELGQESEEED